MTNKYGSENFSLEFRDLQATTMSVDKNGHNALLAGRKYLSIVSLDYNLPAQLVTRVSYGGKTEISNAQWSHRTDSNLFAVASSQKCDIFELTDSAELKRIYQLKRHTRVITDLDWSIPSPSQLATSSFDSSVHIWDIRIPKVSNQEIDEKPEISLPALDGASQVRWNKWNADSIATCDGGHVKIWDIRKPTSPSEYIAAHASKINSLEWIGRELIVTGAQDCTVKFNPLNTQSNTHATTNKQRGPLLTLTAPIWKARPTPFGRGIVTQCVPILRRDSALLSLWDWQSFSSPVFTFQAHDIVEFAWKKTSSWDLVTWSRDQTLRVWSLPPEVIELCGEDIWSTGSNNNMGSFSDASNDDTSLQDIDEFDPNFEPNIPSRRGSKVSPRKDSYDRKSRKSFTPTTERDSLLNDEFEAVQKLMSENVNFEQADMERGLLRFSWKPDPKSRMVSVVVLMSFPVNYPAGSPSFLITSGGNEIDKNQLIKNLTQAAKSCTRKREPCLQNCIQQFTIFMRQLKPLEEPSNNAFSFPSRGVSNIPFPRTSGARFCSVGVLVVFGRPAYLKRVKAGDAGTPRSLSALGPYLSQLTEESSALPITSSFLSGHNRTRRIRRGTEKKKAGLVTLFDVTPLLPFTKELALHYRNIATYSTSRKAICMDNYNISRNSKTGNVAHIWQAASIIADFSCSYNHTGQSEETSVNTKCDADDEDINWITYHPLGTALVHNMITHYARYGDVQTAATVCCQFTVSDQASGYCQHGYRQPTMLPNSTSQETTACWASRSVQNNQPSWNQQKIPGVGSPYHTVHGSDTINQYGVVVNCISDNLFRQHRSNSWSDSLDDGKVLSALSLEGASGGSNGNDYFFMDAWNRGKLGSTKGIILDPSKSRIYDAYKKSYAEILYRWGLLQQRAEVLKCLTEGVESSYLLRSGVDYMVLCKNCNQQIKGPHCSNCKRVISICSICNMPAKGLCMFCSACGHGGHQEHMLKWFNSKRKICPTGCGCECVGENARTFK